MQQRIKEISENVLLLDQMEDRLFEMPLNIDRNSREFDLALLEEIKRFHDIPATKFDALMRKTMRRKSSCKLWITNNPSTEWDGKQYRDCNYKCCPSSYKARSYFCLLLDRSDNGITVKDGFLSAV